MEQISDVIKSMILFLGIFFGLSFVVVLFCRDTPLDTNFQNRNYTFPPSAFESVPGGDFLMCNTYTDAVVLGKKERMTINWTAVFNNDSNGNPFDQANILFTTKENLSDSANNYIEYAAFQHERNYLIGFSAEYAITEENVSKDKAKYGGYNNNLHAGQVYTLRVEIERNGREMKVSRFVDDGNGELALPSDWHTFDQLPDELYLRIGGYGGFIGNVQITDAYSMKFDSIFKSKIFIAWITILALVLSGYAYNLQEANDNEAFSPLSIVLTAIPAMVEFVLLSQFFTDRIVVWANELIRDTLAIKLFTNFPLYISFPLRGSIWFVLSLIFFGVVLAFFLFPIFYDALKPLKNFFLWLIVSVIYVFFIYIYFMWAVALFNAFLPLGVVLLFFGFMGASSSAGNFQTSGSGQERSVAKYYNGNGETWFYDRTVYGDRIILKSYSDESKEVELIKGVNFETDGYLYDEQGQPFHPNS